MRISTATTLLLGALQATACGQGTCPAGAASIAEYIEQEKIVALEQLLCNIGGDGCNAAGAAPGVVVASPSKSDPDCTGPGDLSTLHIKIVYIVLTWSF
ncbi:hypothetical protein IMZ48_31595 [Candidatus Bathyarchaeota archaeon]|nr:hypothetical protein [Candidatus Bathyarchaeota archaeon]